MDALIERFTRRLQADFEGAPARKRRPPGAVHFRERLSREDANLDRADEFLFVGRSDLLRSARIQVRKHLVQMARAMLRGRRAQTLTDFFRAFRQIGKAFQQSAEIEASADGKERELAASTKVT